MQRDDFLSGLLSLFRKREPRFKPFLDGLGNFELSYPEDWKYDKDIALVDGKYTIAFRSPDNRSTFTIAVDAKLPSRFNFARYVRSECGPSSGIIAEMTRTSFHGMPAFKREYPFMCGSRRHFGGEIMFQSMDKVFSLFWNAPESERDRKQAMFDHIMESFRVKRGFAIRKG